MNSVRNRPYGNFLPLRDAVEAIGRQMPNTIKEIDGYRSLNSCKDENSFETGAERAAVDRMLRQANAADRLLQLVRTFPDGRPRWYESVGGYQLLNESVGLEALRILVGWANQRLPRPTMPFGRWSTAQDAPAQPTPIEMQRSQVLGFDIDELIRFLDANQLAHALGEPSETLSGGSANVSSQLALERGEPSASTATPRSVEDGALAVTDVEQPRVLEHHAVIELERRPQLQEESGIGGVKSAPNMTWGSSANRLPFGGSPDGKQPAIGAEIREAQDQLHDEGQKLDTNSVWSVLVDMALSGKHLRLKGVSGANIVYLGAEGRREYARSALKKYLERCAERLNRKAPDLESASAKDAT